MVSLPFLFVLRPRHVREDLTAGKALPVSLLYLLQPACSISADAEDTQGQVCVRAQAQRAKSFLSLSDSMMATFCASA